MTARRWFWSGAALAVAAGLVVLGIDVVCRQARWHAALEGVEFVDYPEKIRAAQSAVTVTGYLVATVDSDVDFYALARREGAHPRVDATLCDSDAPLGAWFHPMPRERQPGARPYRYAVLVPMRGEKADLSRTREDVCLRFRAPSSQWLSLVRSRPVVIHLHGALRDELAAYARRDGPVELALDPACAPRLCEPDASSRDLGP